MNILYSTLITYNLLSTESIKYQTHEKNMETMYISHIDTEEWPVRIRLTDNCVVLLQLNYINIFLIDIRSLWVERV